MLGEGIQKKAADLSADIEEQKQSFEEAAAKKAASGPAAEEAPGPEAAAAEAKPAVQASFEPGISSVFRCFRWDSGLFYFQADWLRFHDAGLLSSP